MYQLRIKKEDFIRMFQKELYNYILVNYRQPIDNTYVVNDLKSPLPRLMKDIPTLGNLKEVWVIDPVLAGFSAE